MFRTNATHVICWKHNVTHTWSLNKSSALCWILWPCRGIHYTCSKISRKPSMFLCFCSRMVHFFPPFCVCCYNYVYGNELFIHATNMPKISHLSPLLVRTHTFIHKTNDERQVWSPYAWIPIYARAPLCLLNPFTTSWQNDYIKPEKLSTRCKISISDNKA